MRDRSDGSPWFGPAVLAAAFVVIVAVLVSVIRADRTQRESDALVADHQAIRQALTARFDGDVAYLGLLADAKAAGTLDETTFITRAADYVRRHPGLGNIIWADADFVIRWAAPYAPNRQVIGLTLSLPESARASRQAMRTRAPVFTDPFVVIQGYTAFEAYVPVYRQGRFIGTFGGVYQLDTLLARGIPSHIRGSDVVSFVDGTGTVVATTDSSLAQTDMLERTSSLGLPGSDLGIQVAAAEAGAFPGLEILAVVGIALALGMAWGMTALRRDIRRRDRLEHELSRSQALLQAVVDGTSDSVYVKDHDGKYLLFNPSAARAAGTEADEVLGRDDATVFSPDVARVFAERDRAVMESGQAITYEQSMPDGTGEPRFFLSTKGPLLDAAGHVAGVFGIARDITERRREEQDVKSLNAELERRVAVRTAQLAKMNEDLLAAQAVKDQFLASMSHELRTPLNSIIGFTGVMLQGMSGPLTDEERTQLKMVANSGRHLLSLINTVLDVARVESGVAQLDIARFDAREPADTVAEAMRPLAEEKALELELHVPSEPLMVVSDALKVQQVLFNLVGNAIKYTRSGRIDVTVDESDAGVRFEVRDTGAGIEPDELSRIFEQFYQVPPSGPGKTPGTGLGLWVSRSFASMLGGTLDARSTPRVGSVFTLTIPRGAG